MVLLPAWNEEENISRMVEELVDKEFPKINADMHLLDGQRRLERAGMTLRPRTSA